MGAGWPAQAQSVDPWAEADAIARGIVLPSIPARSYLITSFGAVGNGSTDCTDAIRRALNAARAAGGGRVVVPAGTFLTGPLSLYNKTGLHLDAGATLQFKTDPAAYLPVVLTRFGGVDCYNYRPLIQAYGRRNVAITGSGTIDGGADNGHWWPWKGLGEFGWSAGQPFQDADIAMLRAQQQSGVPVSRRIYGAGHYLRPSLIQAYGCRNVLLDGVTIRHAPWWMFHALFSTDVTVRNVTFASLGPNNDGCDLECSSEILVENCTFRQRDDKVVIKSGFGRDGVVGAEGAPYPPRPTRNVVVRNCLMADYGAAIAVGSEIGGGAEQIFAENIRNGAGEVALGHICLIKSSTYRGGTIKGVYLRNFDIAACDLEAIRLTYVYEKNDLAGPYSPRFEDITLDGIICNRSRQALNAIGQPGLPIVGLALTNSRFANVEKRYSRVANVSPFTLANVLVNGSPAKVF